MNLKNKVAVVTGSSSGIGQAVAYRFAREGMRVVVNSKTNTKGGNDTVEGIKKMGCQAIYVQADLTDPTQVKKMFSKVFEAFGTLDVLVNNAGRTVGLPFVETTKEHWLESIETNFIGTVLCSVEAVKKMREQGSGKIINTASVRGIGHTGRPGIMAYSASKAAVINLTQTLAKECAPNITVNAVAPGFVATPYLDTVSEEVKKQWLSNIPLGRFIEPDEIAEAYLFLATADVVTGSVLVADGGFTLKNA